MSLLGKLNTVLWELLHCVGKWRSFAHSSVADKMSENLNYCCCCIVSRNNVVVICTFNLQLIIMAHSRVLKRSTE